MRARSRVPAVVALLCAAPPYAVEAQFGSLQVDWSAGSASVSDGTRLKPDANLVPGEARLTNLWELVENQPEQLKSIVESFQIGGCDACQSEGHWVAKVRPDTACAAISGCERCPAHLSTLISAFPPWVMGPSLAVVQVRQGVLEMRTKRIRTQLLKRGIR